MVKAVVAHLLALLYCHPADAKPTRRQPGTSIGLPAYPHLSFHINGGPTAMPDANFERVNQGERDSAAGLHRRKSAHRAFVRAAR
jgi:hypothetical protein